MKKMANPKLYTLIFIPIFLVSCDDSKKEGGKSNGILFDKTINDHAIIIKHDTVSNNFELTFNKSSPIYEQSYVLNDYGTLLEKRGLNFFGEEEVYRFDVNNSLSEMLKLVHVNSTKKGVQEFIRYDNGKIDIAHSHYLDFEILDSSQTDFYVKLEYTGGFKVRKMTILTNDYSKSTQKLNFSNAPTYNGSSASFWVPKDHIYDSELEFFQINAKIYFDYDPSLIKKIDSFSDDKKSHVIDQAVILRKLKTDM